MSGHPGSSVIAALRRLAGRGRAREEAGAREAEDFVAAMSRQPGEDYRWSPRLLSWLGQPPRRREAMHDQWGTTRVELPSLKGLIPRVETPGEGPPWDPPAASAPEGDGSPLRFPVSVSDEVPPGTVRLGPLEAVNVGTGPPPGDEPLGALVRPGPPPPEDPAAPKGPPTVVTKMLPAIQADLGEYLDRLPGYPGE